MTLPRPGLPEIETRTTGAAPSPATAAASSTLNRRAVLQGAASTVLASGLFGIEPALAQPAFALPPAGAAFGETTLADLARALAQRSFAPQPSGDLPEVLKNLGRDQYNAIRTAPGAAIWADAGLDFTIEPLLRGSVFTDRIALYVVENGTVQPIPYARDRFDAGAVQLPGGDQEPGYSGFRIRARFAGSTPSDFAIFQGVSFFRLIARGQGFGVNARALMLRPADSRGEDFVRWRAFFIEKPGPGAPMVIHALLDAESCAAAFRMVLTPGDASVIDVEGRVFTRSAIDHLGLGGAQTAFLFGPVNRRSVDDARAAAHCSGGLQMRAGSGESIWRPVNNPQALQISSFVDDGPKGFGLMQRARDYRAYEDDVQHWEWRPSLWIEPQSASGVDGIWGAGAVTLLEIPSDSELNENVIAYWRPKAVIPAKAEIAFAYRQTWCWQPPEPAEGASLASVSESRSGHGSAEGRRLFLVDFAGDILFSGPNGEPLPLRTVLVANPGSVPRQTLYAYPERRTVRIVFELDPAGQTACELRLALKTGERQVTETWLYRWTA